MQEQAALVDAIVRDLAAHAALTGPRRLVSVFFGGGTPSLMAPAAVARVLDAAAALWTPAERVEVSLEANPTDAEAQRFRDLAAAGVNRLSLGVQALDDAALTFLGRNHGAAEARRAAEVAGVAFARLSLDLIYARPGQSPEAWAASSTAWVTSKRSAASSSSGGAKRPRRTARSKAVPGSMVSW
jgi:coproporphyrinogen III oxidase-like Fe-S oxidoreductase